MHVLVFNRRLRKRSRALFQCGAAAAVVALCSSSRAAYAFVPPAAASATSWLASSVAPQPSSTEWSQSASVSQKRDVLAHADALETLAKVFPESSMAPVVLFDGECNFCNAAAWMLMANSDPGALRFAAQESEPGLAMLGMFGTEPAAIRSIAVLDAAGRLHQKSAACIEIGRRCHHPFPLISELCNVIPEPLRDLAYDWVSANRGVFGHSDSCRLPEDSEMERFILEL